jgi:hypothetical protein
MSGNKSPGVDKIPIKICKDCLASISIPLTDIINQSASKQASSHITAIMEIIYICRLF